MRRFHKKTVLRYIETVVGEKEISTGTCSVRSRKEGDTSNIVREKTFYKIRFKNWDICGYFLTSVLSLLVLTSSMTDDEVGVCAMVTGYGTIILLILYGLTQHTIIGNVVWAMCFGGLVCVSAVSLGNDTGFYFGATWLLLCIVLIFPYYLNICFLLCFVVKNRKLFASSIGKIGIVKEAYNLQFGVEYIVQIGDDDFDAIPVSRKSKIIPVDTEIIVRKQKGTYLVIEQNQ